MDNYRRCNTHIRARHTLFSVSQSQSYSRGSSQVSREGKKIIQTVLIFLRVETRVKVTFVVINRELRVRSRAEIARGNNNFINCRVFARLASTWMLPFARNYGRREQSERRTRNHRTLYEKPGRYRRRESMCVVAAKQFLMPRCVIGEVSFARLDVDVNSSRNSLIVELFIKRSVLKKKKYSPVTLLRAFVYLIPIDQVTFYGNGIDTRVSKNIHTTGLTEFRDARVSAITLQVSAWSASDL